jgi:hypothetical protein
MKQYVLMALLAMSSQSAAADWELLPSDQYCIARNAIDWGKGNIGETRFSWYADNLYLSAVNREWNIATPIDTLAEADFDGVRVMVRVYSNKEHTVVIEMAGTLDNLNLIVDSNVMKIYPVGEYDKFVFGMELDDMTSAAAIVGQCYFTTKA